MVTFLWSQHTRFWWHNRLNRVLQLQKPWNLTWYYPRADLISVTRSSIRLFHREEGETRLFRKFPGRWAVVDAVSCPLSTVFGQKTKKTGGSDRRKGEERVGWERGERKGVVGGGKWSTEKLFPVEEVRIGPTEVRNDRLKEVLLRDKPEVIRLRPKHFFLLVFTRVEKKVYPFQVANGFCFVPFGRDYRPRTNIHSRLTPLFTIRCFSVYPRHPSPPYFLLFFSTHPRRYLFYISPWTS